MTRIVGGVAGGRQVTVPRGSTTRPTSDRAREGLFNTLGSLVDLEGCRFLDLFAGSGAVGLEALSRGAAHCLLVESAPSAVTVIRANAAALGLPGAEVRAASVERVLAGHPQAAYDIAFLDPPYAQEVGDLLVLLRDWVVPGGIVVVERSKRDPELEWGPGYAPERVRRYGEATLWYGRRS